MSKTASKTQQVERLAKILSQQLEILKGESSNLKSVVDQCVEKAQNEVDTWMIEAKINRPKFEKISYYIQQAITFYSAKCLEFSALQNEESENDVSSETVTKTFCKSTSSEDRETITAEDDETGDWKGTNVPYKMMMKFEILEEAVFSLKRMIGQVKEKQENADKLIEKFSVQQDNVNKNIALVNEENLKSFEKIHDRIKEHDKISHETSTNLENLDTNVNKTIPRFSQLEKEIQLLSKYLDDINSQISSIRTFGNNTATSVVDISKRTESSEAHQHCISQKIDELQTSIDNSASQYMEQLERACTSNIQVFKNQFGMICQVLANRLTPLEKLNDAISRQVSTSNRQLSKVDAIENQVAEISNKVTQIDMKCSRPNVGFFAWSTFNLAAGCGDLERFENVKANCGDHFDPSSGKFTAPLNGLYLINISTRCKTGRSLFVACYQKTKKKSNNDADPIYLGHVNENQSITRCTEMMSGDVMYLQSKTFEEKARICVWVNFSCCLING